VPRLRRCSWRWYSYMLEPRYNGLCLQLTSLLGVTTRQAQVKKYGFVLLAYSRILAIVLTAVMRYVNRWSFPRNMQVRARTSFASSQHHATTTISSPRSVDDGLRNSFTTVKSFQRIVVLNSQLGIESDTVLDRGAAVKVPFPFVGCCSVMALWLRVRVSLQVKTCFKDCLSFFQDSGRLHPPRNRAPFMRSSTLSTTFNTTSLDARTRPCF